MSQQPLAPNAQQRQKILELLYVVRTVESHRPWLDNVRISDVVGREDLEFNLNLLSKQGYIRRDSWQNCITDTGVLACEANYTAETELRLCEYKIALLAMRSDQWAFNYLLCAI